MFTAYLMYYSVGSKKHLHNINTIKGNTYANGELLLYVNFYSHHLKPHFKINANKLMSNMKRHKEIILTCTYVCCECIVPSFHVIVKGLFH